MTTRFEKFIQKIYTGTQLVRRLKTTTAYHNRKIERTSAVYVSGIEAGGAVDIHGNMNIHDNTNTQIFIEKSIEKSNAPPRDMPLINIDFDQKTHRNMRVLHCQSLEEDEEVKVWCTVNKIVELDTCIAKPDLSPVDFQMEFNVGYDGPKEIIENIRRFSTEWKDLIKWIKDQLVRYKNDGFHIIILDDCPKSDMVWELVQIAITPKDDIEVPTDQFDELVPLGALATVTRWIPELSWQDNELRLSADASVTSGRVLTHFDHLEHEFSSTEQGALAAFDTEHCSDLESFRKRLGNDLNEIGLIYISSHMTLIDDEMVKNFLPTLSRSDDRAKVFRLPDMRNPTARSSLPVIFVNACYSGWLFKHKKIRWGLPKTILQTLADDLIVTVGQIGCQHATNIAVDILQRVDLKGTCVSPSVILREMRSEVFHRWCNSERTTDDWLEYMFAFMYVYYGTPLRQLSLLPSYSAKLED